MRAAVIPARGGSKRIPRKNIRLFEGKPMLAYAIEVARSTNLFERIIVSTDDAEIADVARACGAETPFVRPGDIADDHAPTVPVIAHAITEAARLGWPIDAVCCIYPGVPLLCAGDITEALALMRPGQFVFPVTPFPSAVQRALRRQADGRTRPFYPEYAQARTQDLEPAFHDAGQFYWADAPTWLSGKSIHLHAISIVMPQWRVVDIDAPEDWERAESLYRAIRAGGMP